MATIPRNHGAGLSHCIRSRCSSDGSAFQRARSGISCLLDGRSGIDGISGSAGTHPGLWILVDSNSHPFVRPGRPSLRPDLSPGKPPRAVSVKGSPKATAAAARCVLDRREHGGTLRRNGTEEEKGGRQRRSRAASHGHSFGEHAIAEPRPLCAQLWATPFCWRGTRTSPGSEAGHNEPGEPAPGRGRRHPRRVRAELHKGFSFGYNVTLKQNNMPWKPRPKQHARATPAMHRINHTKISYKSKHWSKIRTYALSIDPVCGSCLIRPSVEVHHRNGDSYDNRPSNLCSLCKSCHSSLTRTVRDKISE
jgi:hypothetical protein